MVEDALKRLLQAELDAEALVDQANEERERLIRQALEDARMAEQRFEARIPELQASFLQKADERSGQAIAELVRRYHERAQELRALARDREAEAITAAAALVLDPERS